MSRESWDRTGKGWSASRVGNHIDFFITSLSTIPRYCSLRSLRLPHHPQLLRRPNSSTFEIATSTTQIRSHSIRDDEVRDSAVSTGGLRRLREKRVSFLSNEKLRISETKQKCKNHAPLPFSFVPLRSESFQVVGIAQEDRSAEGITTQSSSREQQRIFAVIDPTFFLSRLLRRAEESRGRNVASRSVEG